MIISHKHKFIFIKPQKTAGTSVELFLSRICGTDDIITPLGFDPDPNVREKHKAKNAQNYKRSKPLNKWTLGELFWFLTKGVKPNFNYWEHLHADKIREYIGEEIWNSYTKISIVRNPWDHAVSQYLWMKKYNFNQSGNCSFKDYLIFKYKTQWPFLSTNGLLDVDYIIRFETLENDIFNLCNIISLDENIYELPETKVNAEKNIYKDYYSEETQIIVLEKNLELLHHFRYDF